MRLNPENSPVWQRAVSGVLDLLYPPACALCGVTLSRGRTLCLSCETSLPLLVEPFCQSCGEAFPGRIERPFACPNCHDLHYAFEFARPAVLRDPRTLDLVRRLKYCREIHLAGALGRLAAGAFEDGRLTPARLAAWPLVPVPLHRRRLRHRHFNQAMEISRVMARILNLPVLPALRRTRDTGSQTLLSRKQRQENLRGAFEITRSGRRWLDQSAAGAILVDDVFTTGSTVNECAATLRHAGFHRVVVVTVMRG